MSLLLAFIVSGKLAIGANYWASHAATQMWRNWDAQAVEADLKTLSENGFTILRVFPNWADFQPIHACYLSAERWNEIYETRMFDSEEQLPDTPCGRAGVDERMVEHFEEFCDIADKYGLKLIVPLLTGQMTFRNFIPPALANREPYSDPYALAWEGRYLECMVTRLKAKKAIVAWESGNESRILGDCKSRFVAEYWQRFVHQAIRQADPTRPVIGVDGLCLTQACKWPTSVNAQFSDYVTTHPYGMWGKQYNENFTGIRSAFFCTALTAALEDVSGRPAFVEEHGSRRQEQTNQRDLVRYLRGMLWNLWAADCKAMLWWCAFDQTGMTNAPYDWKQPCVELGIFRRDRTPYPGVAALREFAAFQKSLPFDALPRAQSDALFIVSDNYVVHSSYVLARQAGIIPAFQSAEQPIRDAKCYFFPSANGRAYMTIRNWEALKRKVREGATLYLSWDDTFLDSIEEVCGVEVAYRDKSLTRLRALSAEVIERNKKGEDVFFRNRYGKGTVYTLAYPMEARLYDQVGGYDGKCHERYARVCPKSLIVDPENPMVTVSEHPFGDGRVAVVLVNNGEQPYATVPRLASGYRLLSIHNEAGSVTDNPQLSDLKLPPNSGTLILLSSSLTTNH